MAGIIITGIICLTLIIIAAIGATNNNEQINEKIEKIENALGRADNEMKMLWDDVAHKHEDISRLSQKLEYIIDADKIWENIAKEIKKTDKSFESFVYRHSHAIAVDAETWLLTVGIERRKIDIAYTQLGKINEASNKLYRMGVVLQDITDENDKEGDK